MTVLALLKRRASIFERISPHMIQRFPHLFVHGCQFSGSFKSQSDFDQNYKDLLEDIPLERTRNFSIIAHIDHGKSTLSDRLLELVGNISEHERKGKPQLLDQLKVERERGITVKAQSAAMLYKHEADGLHYLLNLVDTPGHVDFSYEVTRSLAACEGALLLVDASQGIQAQTLSTYFKAQKQGMKLIPIVTKIDLPHAMVEDTILAIATTFKMEIEDVITTSAKTGEGIETILPAIVSQIPPPNGNCNAKHRCRIIDSWYDQHRGVICLVQVVDGLIEEGNRITSFSSSQSGQRQEEFSIQEVGLLCPHHIRTNKLKTGQVGYLVAGMRSTSQALMGDTLFLAGEHIEPITGFEPPKSMLYASVYPVDNSEYDNLCKAVDKLALNDSSISIIREGNSTLGSGLRCGFLGLLHMEVFNQRLQDEFNTPILITTPTVPYLIKFKDGTEDMINTTQDWPVADRQTKEFKVYEPTVKATLIVPSDSLGAILEVLQEKRGQQIELKYIDETRIKLSYILPWQEVVIDLHDQVKNISAGYASFDYEEGEYKEADLVKVDVALNQEPVEALAFICHRSKAEFMGRKVCEKLKSTLDRQQFEIAIQVRLGRKVFARETLKAYRKDVLTKKSGKTVGGGDVTRKKKLLEKQKKGKRRSKMVGKVQISQEAFWSVIQR